MENPVLWRRLRRLAAETPEEIETDPDKVRQILKNFLANAVKFTERGGVTLRAGPASRRPGCTPGPSTRTAAITSTRACPGPG